MITNNSNNNNYVFLNVFMFRIMGMTLMNINIQKENFHHYDFPVYTASKYRVPILQTYRRITLTHDAASTNNKPGIVVYPDVQWFLGVW